MISEGTAESGTVQSGKEVWYTWTTQSGGTYQISITNQTANGGELQASLFDGEGTELKYTNVAGDGQSSSIAGAQLEGNTSYYVRLNPRSSETLDYTVLVENMSSSGTVSMATEEESDQREAVQGEELVPGSNQENSILLPLGTEAFGTYQPGSYSWFAFTTGEKTGATYKVTLVNETVNSNGLEGILFDEYGERISRDGWDWNAADSSGTPSTYSTDTLQPDTTYYVRLGADGEQQIEYSLAIKSSEPEPPKQNTLVFEKPFEINETQVQFVINKAEFIDKEKAKKVLKPVAEAILANPDHAILIAGTTATDGTQESCVDLSLRRTEAVKKLLTETYQVPESQIQVVGLGYENDPFERGKDRDANGNFVESEGKKNRRVVILDVDDPIAQELLKNNK